MQPSNLLLSLALSLVGGIQVTAQEFRIQDIARDATGRVTIRHAATPDHYYLLLHGATATTIATAIDAVLGRADTGELRDQTATDQQRFYRVRQVPLSSSLDTDADGLPDVYELQRPAILNPLKATDAALDPDGDGASNLTEFQRGTDPAVGALTTIAESSPAQGEPGVAVTRETILRFTRALAADALIKPEQFYAEGAGRRILSRVQLSTDRRTVTLFYQEHLPASARIRVTFDGTGLKDDQGQALDADGDRAAGGVATVEFDTLSITGISGTAIVGRVFASELAPNPAGRLAAPMTTPLADVMISVDGAEQRLLTFTDADGNFTLDPCPAGRFFVHVDGRTAELSDYPDGAYYPVVGKAWEAVAGRTDNKAGGTGEIYLPLIRAGTLQDVSISSDTAITFPPDVLAENPALAGVSITVPANSLFSDEGIPGGKVGIAPVAPDRLPEPLPAGLAFPLVITIQTSGPSNFDRPVPVRFPNLPDPKTGEKLLPGAKSALWSFNHDTGRWEIQGPMTVTPDGNYIESDPGVGVRQPGWHGSAPGTDGGGGDEDEDECEESPAPEECYECEEGQPCDDGDECTRDDRCVNHVCEGMPPAPVCGANTPTAVDYGGWKEEATNAAFSSTTPEPEPYEATVCYDPGVRGWRLQVTAFRCPGTVRLATNFMEPNPVPGGNVTLDNYCDEIIADLSDYFGGGYAVGGWHTQAASRAHEAYHRDTDLPNTLDPLWADTELVIESATAACTLDEASAEAELHFQADAAFTAMEQAFWDAWLAPDAEHDVQAKGGAYRAGQDSLNATIAAIQAFAASQGWPACPAPGPMRARLQALAGEPLLLWRVTATADSTVLQPGQSAQLRVQGELSDGTKLALPTPDFPVEFTSRRSAIVSVSADGKVTAVGPGRAIVLAAVPPGRGLHPRLAAIGFLVPWPSDRDADRLPNEYEVAHGLNPDDPGDARSDHDGDGLANLDEYRRGTDPASADTDGDGEDDGTEVREGQNPRSARLRRLRSVTGQQYFLIYDLDNHRVVQRGLAGADGTAHTGLILAPRTRYRHWLLHAPTLRTAVAEYVSANNGERFRLPAFTYRRTAQADGDGDGLSDLAEFIVGANPRQADTDGDGLRDGAEVSGGTNPLDGLIAAVGIVAAADTPGKALDVSVTGDHAVVADGTAGVAVFNVFNGLNPTLVGQVDTPGTGQAVACDDDHAAVADGSSGLAIVDVSDPAQPRVVHQVAFGATASAVAARDGVAYVVLEAAGLAAVDLGTGAELVRLTGLGETDDVVLGNGLLYVLTSSELRIHRDVFGGMAFLGSVNVSGSPAPLESGRKLFVCGPLAYVGTFTGYHTVDVSNPAAPKLVGSPPSSQAAIHDLAHDGNQTLVAVTSFGGTRTLAVSLYDTRDPKDVTKFLTSFNTPGDCRAVALSKGLAYVADSNAGLLVVNYLSGDTKGFAPTVTITPPPIDVDPAAPGTQVFGGSVVTPGLRVSDDVQIRQVELLLDGTVADSDSAWPFELSARLPQPTAQKNSVTLQARATDTGGNAGWSELLTLELRAGPPSPFLVSSTPAADGTEYDLVQLSLLFDVPLDPAPLSLAGCTLLNLGADGQPGGGDDTTVALSSITALVQDRLVSLGLAEVLPVGAFELQVKSDIIADTAGVPMASQIDLRFTVAIHPSSVFWISDAAGNWSDASRWSTGAVPGANDLVVIDRPGANPVVTLDTAVSAGGLRCAEPLALLNHKLTLTGTHGSELTGAVTISNATISVSGLGALFVGAGITQADDASFLAADGARLRLPNLTTFTAAAISDKTIRATGANSRVEIPNLAGMAGPTGRTIFFFFPVLKLEALAGGVVDLSRVEPTLDGRVRVLADGAGSVVNLPAVESMFMSDILILGGLEAKNGGSILCGSLTMLTHQNLTLNEAATLTTRQLARSGNVVVTVNGGSPDFSSLASVETLQLTVRSNALVSLPALVDYPVGAAATWLAEGAGSTLRLPALNSLAGPEALGGIPKLWIEARSGGLVDLSQLRNSPSGRIVLFADGAGSRVEISGLTEYTGKPDLFRSWMEAKNGGTIAMANLTAIKNVDLILHPGGGLPTAQLRSFTVGHLAADAVNPDLAALTEATSAGFSANAGAVITLPSITAITIDEEILWEAHGAGSRLDFANLTSVTGPASGRVRLTVRAVMGGEVNLTGLTEIPSGRFTFTAVDAGSAVNLANVTSLACTSGSICEADKDGVVRLSSGTATATGVNFQVNPTGMIEVGALDLGANAVLSGNGTLAANVTDGGEVRPGGSAGALTIQGDFTQTVAGRLRSEIGGLDAGTQFDQLNVTGVATLGGNLTVSYISGFTLAAGQSFRVLTFGSRAGDFATTTGLTQGAVTLDLTYSDTALDLMAR
ncbi:MAG: Ig-like domain-containing protein [Verrucomicrobia bacterium]|nr:Ig-like domain-containing protein [Verrucomicrobiota bacterium]